MSLNNYIPTSLIGCAYKILSKILATRLRKVLDGLISQNQSAFIRDKYILDGVVILNEVIAETKRKKIKCMLFKIDFENVYESVDWKFLGSMMEYFKFSRKWRNWILECVSQDMLQFLLT